MQLGNEKCQRDYSTKKARDGLQFNPRPANMTVPATGARPAMIRIGLLTVTLSALAQAPSTENAPTPMINPAHPLRSQKAVFAEREKQLRRVLSERFQSAESAVRATRALSPAARAARIDALRVERQAFDMKGTFPACDEMQVHLWKYQADLHKARAILLRAYHAEIDARSRSNQSDLLKQLSDERATLESPPGRADFARDTSWKGTRHEPTGSNSELTLTINECGPRKFKATLKQTPGSVTMLVEGTVDCAWIEFRTTEVLKGKTKLLAFAGYLMGDRILLGVGGVNTSGTLEGGYAVLRK